VKSRDLAQLQSLRDELTRRAAEAELTRQRERAAAQEAARLQRLFSDSVGPVNAITQRALAAPSLPPPSPEPRQTLLDAQAAMREAMSDEVNVESLLLTDDGLSFRRAGVDASVVTRLRRGHWAVQAELDLHGHRREEAREALAQFVRQCARSGARCLRVVHGKGHGSPGKQPVLKDKVHKWLAQCAEVIAFTQASGPEGGAGALLVLLAGAAKR
jgi:DNA-nicking Smr family endonuclease